LVIVSIVHVRKLLKILKESENKFQIDIIVVAKKSQSQKIIFVNFFKIMQIITERDSEIKREREKERQRERQRDIQTERLIDREIIPLSESQQKSCFIKRKKPKTTVASMKIF
jgi:hypothetical protein